MADLGDIESDLAGLSQEKDKPIWKRIFRAVVKTMAFGPVDRDTGKRASTNFRGHLYGPIVMPAVANTEMPIAHSFATAPYGLIPYLPNETDAQIVPLKWTRAWDAKRIYISTSVVSPTIYFYLEG